MKNLLKAPAVVRQLKSFWRGYRYWRWCPEWPPGPGKADQPVGSTNPLRTFVDARTTGPGIWKWNHYFEIYHRHLDHFRGRDVRVLEIGVYSGGSLDMWKHYFGDRCCIYGVDIEPACKAYQRDGVQVIIGDQSSRDFWDTFKQQVAPLDIAIDDGSHVPEMQIVTLEELLPHLRPGGVYICEDIHGTSNLFSSYVAGLCQSLNACDKGQNNINDNQRRIVFQAIRAQSMIHAVHVYPYMAVIERNSQPVQELVAAKHGTEWQPFLK